MTEIITFFGSILGKTENIAVIVCLGMCVFLGWMLTNTRKEDREDRKAFVESLDKNTNAITDLRIALAALSGKIQ